MTKDPWRWTMAILLALLLFRLWWWAALIVVLMAIFTVRGIARGIKDLEGKDGDPLA